MCDKEQLRGFSIKKKTVEWFLHLCHVEDELVEKSKTTSIVGSEDKFNSHKYKLLAINIERTITFCRKGHGSIRGRNSSLFVPSKVSQCHSIWIEHDRMFFKVVYSEKRNCY